MYKIPNKNLKGLKIGVLNFENKLKHEYNLHINKYTSDNLYNT